MQRAFVYLICICLLWRSSLAADDSGGNKGKSKTVSTLLNAKWTSTPIALEISECLHEEDPSYFWMFLESLNQNSNQLASSSKYLTFLAPHCSQGHNILNVIQPLFPGTEKAKYEVLVELAAKYLSTAQLSLMKFSLGLHVYSPKIEMFHQVAMVQGVGKLNCDAVAVVNGKLTCEPSEIDSFLKDETK